MFLKKRVKKEQRTTLIIEEMVTDNNGIPILNFGTDAIAFEQEQIKKSQNRKRSEKKVCSRYTKYFVEDKK